MHSKTQLATLAEIADIEIGFEESAVVQVEFGEKTGYLIAGAYHVEEPPSGISLQQVIYLCTGKRGIETAEAPDVLVSVKNDCWFAVETSEIAIIPCPSRKPYPIIFISKHGYRWMLEMTRDGNFTGLIDHLNHRFPPSGFATSRTIFEDTSSPFHMAARIKTTSIRTQR